MENGDNFFSLWLFSYSQCFVFNCCNYSFTHLTPFFRTSRDKNSRWQQCCRWIAGATIFHQNINDPDKNGSLLTRNPVLCRSGIMHYGQSDTTSMCEPTVTRLAKIVHPAVSIESLDGRHICEQQEWCICVHKVERFFTAWLIWGCILAPIPEDTIPKQCGTVGWSNGSRLISD